MTSTGPPPPDRAAARLSAQLRLYGWRHPAILAAGWFALAAGFAQFGATTALGDVAKSFGAPQGGDSIAARVGLSGATLGIGLGVIRLASLGSLPLAGLADRFGRRRTLIGCVTLGLALTASAALSPSFWWFVAIFALGRPLLSATNTVAGVVAAEETRSHDRVKAIALVTAGYAIGAGLTALLRGVAGDELGFRGLFALALVPFAATPLIASWLKEPERYQRLRTGAALGVAAADAAPPPPASGHAQVGAGGGLGALWIVRRLRASLKGRLWVLTSLTFAFSFVIGPMNTFLFVYAENALGMARSATALMVLAAGPLGLAGLLVGRWAADSIGRRRAAAVAQALVALAGMVTYSGSSAGAVGGYLLAIVGSAAYGPATAALAAELFPTSVRATVAGWLVAAGVLGAVVGLVAFGTLADALSSFGLGAVLVCAPVVVASLLFARLPETVGLELEQSAPE
ncbi:MAG TPA: MFS transporter [Actinomycetota bacterium]|nr:MFS transporter [Actinomycetota bacterium]